MSTTTTFTPQLLGQTEKTLNAILARRLVGTGLNEARWIALTQAVMAGGGDHDELAGRLAGGLHIGRDEAEAHLAALAAAELIDVEGSQVTVTDAGQQLHGTIRAGIGELTERLWGDLPADDLATAARVLSEVHARAQVELEG